jgi:integrase
MAPNKKRKNNGRARRRGWNKGVEVGKKDAFTPDQVKRIRGLLAKRGVSGLRDLALFSIAIDAMLRGRDLLGLLVRDVQNRNGSLRSTIEVSQKRSPPVRRALSKSTARALEKWIAHSGKKASDYLFSGRDATSGRPMTPRQLNRLVKLWVTEAGLDPTKYGADSLRRTKALHILRSTGDLRTVGALLGHVKIESTSRFLGVETTSDYDALEVSRTFEI